MTAVKSEAATIMGYVGGVATTVMLDSGSSVSLFQKDFLSKVSKFVKIRPVLQLQLLTASGDEIPIQDYVSVVMQLDKERISHNFVVVGKLIVQVILGVDYLQGNGLTLDFSSTPPKVGSHNCQAAACISLEARTSGVPLLLHPQQQKKLCVCIIE